MSFILDALRKSEHERQRHSGPDIAHPHGATRRTAFALPLPWILGIAALLAVNLVVVLTVVLRGEQQQTNAEVLPEPTVPATVTPEVLPARQDPQPPPATTSMPLPRTMAAEGESLPAPPAPQTPPTLPYAAPAAVDVPTLPRPDLGAAPQINEQLPTIHELNLRGANALPPLRLDIHVYATSPESRFVHLNMKKYREGERTPEGILVERITPDGVVLDRDGMRFLLPRQ